jgi:hypothetical protein
MEKNQTKQHNERNAQQYAEHLFEQISSDFNSTLPTIPQYKLQAAIKKGIDRGNKQKTLKNNFKKWGLPTGAVVVCALLFTILSLDFTWTRLGNQMSGTTNTSMMGKLPDHITAQLDTQALQNAAKYGLYQPINQTSQQDRFSFTLDGIITDGSRATIFFTMNVEPSAPWESLSTISFTDENGLPLNANTTMSANNSVKHNNSDINKISNKIDVFYKSGKLPKNIIMTATPTSKNIVTAKVLTKADLNKLTETAQEFQVKIPIDGTAYSDMVEEIVMNKQAKANNYDFTIEKAILRPLSTELQIKMNNPNLNVFHNFIEPKLTVSDAKTYSSTRTVKAIVYNKGTNTISIYFDSIYYLSHDSILFQASGIRTNFNEQPKLVIDTVKEEILKSPDEFIALESITNHKANDTTEILLKINQQSNDDDTTPFVSEIQDADGVKYPIRLRNYSLSVGTKEKNETQTLRISFDTKNYSQPLTLTLPNYHKQQIKDIEIPLIGNQNQ